MKKIGKLKLIQLNKNELEKRELSNVRGGIGESCGCGCHYAGNGGSSLRDNQDANAMYGYGSPGGNVICWSWNGWKWVEIATN